MLTFERLSAHLASLIHLKCFQYLDDARNVTTAESTACSSFACKAWLYSCTNRFTGDIQHIAVVISVRKLTLNVVLRSNRNLSDFFAIVPKYIILPGDFNIFGSFKSRQVADINFKSPVLDIKYPNLGMGLRSTQNKQPTLPLKEQTCELASPSANFCLIN